MKKLLTIILVLSVFFTKAQSTNQSYVRTFTKQQTVQNGNGGKETPCNNTFVFNYGENGKYIKLLYPDGGTILFMEITPVVSGVKDNLPYRFVKTVISDDKSGGKESLIGNEICILMYDNGMLVLDDCSGTGNGLIYYP
jgi:hypothetical protein